ncbi:MAG: DUF4342 domain-containing protein [Leptolyngbyaceae cyanobacterium MO_188.B28]|nr:DUF4342 domain-containing protein [Leptolyngbyaceae cyanobacterium MO_188.B28]
MTEPSDRIGDPSASEHTESVGSHNVRVEEFKVSGDTLLEKIQELFHEGNIRRILIKNQNGKTLLEIPLTAGLIGGALGVAIFPILAAVAAIGALVARLTLVVEKEA